MASVACAQFVPIVRQDALMDTPMFDKELLALVRSPASGSQLQSASRDLVERINAAIASQAVHDQSGSVVANLIDSGLVDLKKRCLFPVRQGITILVSGQAIPLTGFEEGAKS